MLTCSGPTDVRAERERLFEKRARLVVEPQPLIDAADHRRHFGLHLWLSVETFRHALRADVEQVAHGRFVRVPRAVRIGAVEQVREQLAHLRRPGGLAGGAVALVRELHGVERNRGGDEHRRRRAARSGCADDGARTWPRDSANVSGRAVIG